METIQWGIIGCGNVTEVKSGPAFNKAEGSRLAAVMRRNGEKAKDYAARHGVPKWYADGEELINDPEVNAVYVATPPLFHEEYTVKALEAGKPVYVEKPMAVNERAAKNMEEAAKRTGSKLCIAHYRRQQPLFLKVKALLREGAIGKVRLITLQLWQPPQSNITASSEENWRVQPAVSGGGLFHDLAPHQLDLMLYFFGTAKKASGLSFNQGGYYPADDVVCGQVLFKEDILFNGLWSFAVPESEKRDRCEIIGEGGKISFPVFDHRFLHLVQGGKEEVLSFEPLEHVQQPMIEKVVQYFLGKAENPCPAEAGVEVMHLMEAFTSKETKK